MAASLLRATKVEQRSAIVRLDRAEGDFLGIRLRIVQGKPPRVDVAEDTASDIVPVSLCVRY